MEECNFVYFQLQNWTLYLKHTPPEMKCGSNICFVEKNLYVFVEKMNKQELRFLLTLF